ncbi:MAG TPA: hypothetical protein VK188_15335 [Holophaga sp.]|nr:hypothetical protein [Holophaga sp.]
MEPIRLEASRGRLRLELTCVPMGEDLLVAVSGGTRPHIGAVALAQARPSLRDPGARSATASVLALLGHKEDGLARTLALTLSARTGAAVAVACGIHLDGAAPGELRDAEALAEQLAAELSGRLGGVDRADPHGHHGKRAAVEGEDPC